MVKSISKVIKSIKDNAIGLKTKKSLPNDILNAALGNEVSE